MTMFTLTPYAAEYVRQRRARGEINQQTASDYRWTLNSLTNSYGNRPVDRFGPAAIDRWLESIGSFSDTTRREYLSRVRGFARWMLQQQLITVDPTAHIPPIRQARRTPRTLTRDEVGRLLTYVQPMPRANAVVWLMVGVGLRCVSVSRLRLEDYDPTARTLHVTAKGGHEYPLPVPDPAARALNQYLDTQPSTAGPLIRSELNPQQPLAPKTLSGYLRRWMLAAGVKVRPLDGRSAHGLRRTAASDVLEHSGDIRAVQAMLGHARLETTARSYLRDVTVPQLRAAMAGRDYAA